MYLPPSIFIFLPVRPDSFFLYIAENVVTDVDKSFLKYCWHLSGAQLKRLLVHFSRVYTCREAGTSRKCFFLFDTKMEIYLRLSLF